MHRSYFEMLKPARLIAALGWACAISAQAQTVVSLPASSTAAGALTYTWATQSKVFCATFDGKGYGDYFWLPGDASPSVSGKWVYQSSGSLSADLKPRPGAATSSVSPCDGTNTDGPSSLWLRSTGVTSWPSQLVMPMSALQAGKRYRMTAIVQSSAPARLQIGLGSTRITAGRSWQVTSSAASVSADFVYQPAGKGETAAVWVFPLTDNVDYYIDDFKLELIDADPINLAGDLSFGVAKSSTPLPMDPMMFGFTANSWAQTAWPDIGQTILRLWDNGTYWAAIEPQKGVYSDTTTDGGVTRLSRFVNQYAVAHGAQVLYTMGIAPPWATGGTCTGPYSAQAAPLTGCNQAPLTVDDWNHWAQYVYYVATKYKGSIKYFELWNEPDSMFAGSMSDFVRLAQLARTSLTQAESALGLAAGTFKLVAPTFTAANSVGLDDFLYNGGGQWVDIFAYHSGYKPYGLEVDVAAPVANVKLTLAAYGQGGKPIWDTEGQSACANDPDRCPASWNNTPPVDVQRGAHIRALAMLWANGVSNFDYYFLEGAIPGESWTALATASSGYTTPTPLGAGFKKASDWLKGLKMTSSYQASGAPVVIQTLSNSSGWPSYLLWNTSLSAVTVKLPGYGYWPVTRLKTPADTNTTGVAVPWDRTITLQPLSPVFLSP